MLYVAYRVSVTFIMIRIGMFTIVLIGVVLFLDLYCHMITVIPRCPVIFSLSFVCIHVHKLLQFILCYVQLFGSCALVSSLVSFIFMFSILFQCDGFICSPAASSVSSSVCFSS